MTSRYWFQPMTATSITPSMLRIVFSSSAGATWRPFTLISSFLRSSIKTEPV